jgi:phosphoglucosamine mutase
MTARGYFGTDGIRGLAGTVLTPELVLRAAYGYAQALAGKRYAPQGRPLVALGQDSRLSSPMLSAAVASGLNFGGCDALLLGRVPTPVVVQTVRQRKLAGGIMVTASHNPVADNGVKFFATSGLKIEPELERAVERVIDQAEPYRVAEQFFGVSIEHDPQPDYLVFIKRAIKLPAKAKPLRVVLDCANGATAQLAPLAFAQAGFAVETINAKFDGAKVNVRCGATDLSALCRAVKRSGADLGLAFDGDGDRVLAVDELGQPVNGDKLIALLALRLPRYRKTGAVVMTHMTNMGIERQLSEHGIRMVRTDVGDVLVMRALLEQGLLLGGEQSGHIILRDLLPGGDGILAGLQFATVVAGAREPLSALAAGFPEFSQLLTNLQVQDKYAWQRDKAVARQLAAVTRKYPQVRFYLRPSGTEQLIRVLTEAAEDGLCRASNAEACAVLAGQG